MGGFGKRAAFPIPSSSSFPFLLFDEAFEHLPELLVVVRAVDDADSRLLVVVDLSAELAAVVLEHVCEVGWGGGR